MPTPAPVPPTNPAGFWAGVGVFATLVGTWIKSRFDRKTTLQVKQIDHGEAFTDDIQIELSAMRSSFHELQDDHRNLQEMVHIILKEKQGEILVSADRERRANQVETEMQRMQREMDAMQAEIARLKEERTSVEEAHRREIERLYAEKAAEIEKKDAHIAKLLARIDRQQNMIALYEDTYEKIGGPEEISRESGHAILPPLNLMTQDQREAEEGP